MSQALDTISEKTTPDSESENRGFFTAVIPPLAGEFLYSYNRTAYPTLGIGDVVEVFVGRRLSSAFIISINSEKEVTAQSEMTARGITIKGMSKERAPTRAFTSEHLSFFQWVAKYYSEPLSRILDLAVPTPSISKPVWRYALTTDTFCELAKLPKLQAAAISYLQTVSTPARGTELKQACGVSPTVLRALEKKGLITRIPDDPLVTGAREHTPPEHTQSETLNSEQREAVDTIGVALRGSSFETFLLEGVTGSGKTEVYLEMITDALRSGSSALVLVPEIALTPQLTDRFAARLRQPIAVLHSSLKSSERWRHWSDLASGRTRVAIGARSAIFAPMHNLGIIVVDEEHDSSFKQGEGIRYHARDIALVRAKLSSCPVILGSATPSLETYHNALSGKYRHARLTRQYYDAAAPAFEIVDLNGIKPWEMCSKNVSPVFARCLRECLEAGQQAFVLYNKRGFASYLQCSSCEYVIGCPHCSVTLTYHRDSHSLLCHQCSFTTTPPVVCMGCGKSASTDPGADPLFAPRGSGTERVHEELQALFPKARIAKLDRDSVSTIQDYVEILNSVRNREVDILVGTQMIAKGHDLPNVTFVGIVDCDVGLHIPDFRAAEKGFQLLTQVAGRAGRRQIRGHVTLQTRVPTHPSLTMTASANFQGFAQQELTLRKTLGYPPFQRLLRVIVASEDRSLALSRALEISKIATSITRDNDVTVLGPASAPIEKVRGLWRYHILLKCPSASILQHSMRKLRERSPANKHTRVIFDLDPQDML